MSGANERNRLEISEKTPSQLPVDTFQSVLGCPLTAFLI